MADPKIRYDIEAGIKGEQDVVQLEAALRGLGDTLEGDLKVQAKEAADALANLGAKQGAVQAFTALKRETETLGAELNITAAAVDRLGAELPQAAAATAQFAAAEASARGVAKGAKADLDEQRAALAALNAQYKGSARQTDAYREAHDQLKVAIKDLGANLKTQQAAVAAAAGASKAAQDAERNLATQYERSVDASRKISAEVGNKTRALNASRASLTAYGISSTNLVGIEQQLATAIAQVRERVNTLAPAFAAAATASNGAAQRQIADQRTVQQGLQNVRSELAKIQTIASVAVGGGLLGGMVKSVAETADEFKNLQARVRLATGEGEAFNVAFAGIQRVALSTNSSLTDTGTLFQRVAKAGTDAGLSTLAATQQSLALTETINQAVQLSGSSADSSAAAITQLIQGLQSGVLRGEEFNSVMEQAPRLAQALAAGVGRTTGELRKMAEQGALTTDVVIKALTTQAATVSSEFGKLPATVGRSLQNLSTQWSLYVGATDNGFVSSKNLAAVIDGLARNLDLLVGTLTAAGKAYAAFKIAGLAADAYRWATATAVSTVAVQANTVAVGTNTAAHAVNAAAQRASTAAALGTGKGFDAMNARVSFGSAILGRFSGLLGPFGIAIAAVTPEILGLARAAGEGVAKLQGYGKILEDAESKTRLLEAASTAAAASQREIAIKTQATRDAQFGLSQAAQDVIGKFDEMVKKGDSATDAVGKIGKDFDLATVPGIANAAAVLDKLQEAGKISAGNFQHAWSEALKGEDLGVFETKARAAFAGAAREGERLAAVLDGTAREAIRRSGLDYDVLAGKIGAASRSAINDTDAIVASLDRLKASGVDTGTALAVSIGKSIETADSQKAIEAVRAQIVSLRKELGDKAADGLLSDAAAKADTLRVKLAQLVPGIQSAAEAFALFGIKSGAELQKSATDSLDAYNVLKTSGVASANQLRQAFEKTAADVTAANKGIPPTWLAIDDAIIRSREEVENYGRSTGGVIDGLRGKWKDYGDTVRREGSATPGVIKAGGQDIKSVTGDTREERLSGQNAVDASLQFRLRDQLKKGTLDPNAQRGEIQTVIDSLKQQAAVNASATNLSAGFMSLEGMRDAASWQAIRAQLEDTLRRTDAATARASRHEVELSMPGGESDVFAMESEDDAMKLINLLGNSKKRSSKS